MMLGDRSVDGEACGVGVEERRRSQLRTQSTESFSELESMPQN